MFKKIIVTSLLLAGCFFSRAQAPVLTAANFNPVVGDAFITHNCATLNVLPQPGGANVTWNFSGLVDSNGGAGTIDTGGVVECPFAQHCATFPGSTYAIVPIRQNVISYIITATGKLSQNGYYSAADTLGTYTDPMDVVQYPFTYPGNFSDTYAGNITFGAFSAAQAGTVNDTCDGYGTLILPGGITHNNVLRSHSRQIYTDNANLFGTSVTGTFQFDTYSWYTPNYHTALLTILFEQQTGGILTLPINGEVVTYTSAPYVDAVPVVPGIEGTMQIFPNPTQNQLNIKFNVEHSQQVRITLSDMLGRQVAVLANNTLAGAQLIHYNTEVLPKGMYIVRLQSAEEVVARQIEIR